MSEQSAVQNPMIKYAGEIGWEVITREDATVLRGGEAGLYFTDLLRDRLLRLNDFLTEDLAGEVIRRLGLLQASIEGNREGLAWLRGEKSVFVPAENRERNVRLLVSMIHKFDGIAEKVNEREGIVVLVDEAHRTTGGDLGNYLEGAIPNATYIGFTGTPIDELSRGRGTFKVFGRDDEDGYTDKYSVAESIEDGTTVKLNYALAPSELLVDEETLEREFLGLMESEGVAEIEEVGRHPYPCRHAPGDDEVAHAKVLNLRKILTTKVREESRPYMVRIGQRAHKLAEAYQDRQLTTKAALEAFSKLADEVVEAESERTKLSLSENAFAIYLALEPFVDTPSPEFAGQLDALFQAYPDHDWNAQQKAKLRTALYQKLRDEVPPAKLVPAANALLDIKRV